MLVDIEDVNYRHSDVNYRDVESRALVADDFIRVHEQPLYCKTIEETQRLEKTLEEIQMYSSFLKF